MWLTTSSIGRKVIMSVTGVALVLFLTFHACMNVVAVISTKGYNAICEFLGANWYAVAATAVLAALIVLHFVYAILLTLQNRKARGASRYAVTHKPEKVEWASQNMLVLGIIVVLGLLLHLFNFWFNMMYAELANEGFPFVDVQSATDGVGMIAYTFHGAGVCSYIYIVLYLIWLCALWFHLSHGIWSGLQTLGLNNKVWFGRLQCVSTVWATLVILCFVFVVVWFALGLTPICG